MPWRANPEERHRNRCQVIQEKMDVGVADARRIEFEEDIIGAWELVNFSLFGKYWCFSCLLRGLTWFGDWNHFHSELEIWSFIVDDACLALLRYVIRWGTHFDT